MPNISEMSEVPRREMTIFYVLDTSGSMTGTPIATLNRAMGETVNSLKELAEKNADAKLKIAVLEFNSGCKWVNANGAEYMEDFVWEDLDAGGLTDVGAALKELDSKMSRSAFLESMTGQYMPIVIFMSDGYATDDYKTALTQIRENKWFKRGVKIGFALGDDPDVAMIADVVGNSEAVIKTNDLELFARLIKFASVTSSMVNSKSRTTSNVVTGAEIVRTGVGSGDIKPGDVVPPGVGTVPPEPIEPVTTSSGEDPWGEDWD